MANLLSRQAAQRPFPRLDPAQLERFRSRRRDAIEIASLPDGMRRVGRRLESVESTLEELESEASVETAHELLDEVDRARRDVIRESRSGAALSTVAPEAGGLLCYRPARSLSTGEAELASRGFFDVFDRPPLCYWLEAIARPTEGTNASFDVAILVWTPAAESERIAAGIDACPNGALAWLGEGVEPGYRGEVTRDLATQLQASD